MRLHPNAAVRLLRDEYRRLADGRTEMVEAIDDPRIPAGVVADQLAQCDRELEELTSALKLLAEHDRDQEQITLNLVAVRAA